VPSSTIRIAIAASTLVPGIHPDDELFVAELRARGFQCEPVIWNDPSADWQAFDAVLIRTIWDYFQNYAAYLRWLDVLEQSGLPVLNPLPLLRWNSDKRYLLELERLGVTIIPTHLASAPALPAYIRTRAGEELVVKPTVSGTSWHTVRGVAGSADFDAAVAALPAQMEFLIQPFAPEVVQEGEWSLLFFGGEYSHCLLKRPASGDYRVQNEFGGSTQTIQPTPTILESARHALKAAEQLGGRNSCYARIDGVHRDGRFLIMEVEMIEPALYFEGNLAASKRFVRAIEQYLSGA
jgi:glutathione synthase/RimK-type ligase-like ATP-grasp enzyme